MVGLASYGANRFAIGRTTVLEMILYCYFGDPCAAHRQGTRIEKSKCKNSSRPRQSLLTRSRLLLAGVVNVPCHAG